MSQLKEILVKERERSTMEQCTVIHLFREGTFYRAYEWSAWLCLRYFTELKVTHRLLKSGEDIVFVGFPLTSFDRYTPHGALVSPSGDKSVEITLPGEAFAPGVDCESLQKGFDDWKQCHPILPNCSIREGEYQHLQCGKTTICGCRGTTIQQCWNIRICNPKREITIALDGNEESWERDEMIINCVESSISTKSIASQ